MANPTQKVGNTLASVIDAYTEKRNQDNRLQAEMAKYKAEQNMELEQQKKIHDFKTKTKDMLDTRKQLSKSRERIQDIFHISRLRAKQKKGKLEGEDLVQLQMLEQKHKIKSPIATEESGLTSEQQLQAAQIARRIGGVRGMKALLPKVYDQMRQGKSMDDIEDNLRYASQSDKMTGTIRRAVQSVVMGASPSIQERTMDFVDDALSKGNYDEVKEVIKRTVLSQVPVDQKNQLVGSERTLEFLNEIQNDLNVLESQGINTNIFSGTLEEVMKKVGTVKEPELRRVATKVAAAIQKYRRSMSGVAFSVPESREYEQMFPGINKTGAFNMATINGLKETLSGDLENIYGLYMGKGNYRELFPDRQSTAQSSGFKIISVENV